MLNTSDLKIIIKNIVISILLCCASVAFFAVAVPVVLDQADKEQQWSNERLIEQGYIK